MSRHVVFEKSGSMGGRPFLAALRHARATLPPETPWSSCSGDDHRRGRLDGIDGQDLWFGAPGILKAIAHAMAPGVELTVYVDDELEAEEGLVLLTGADATIVAVCLEERREEVATAWGRSGLRVETVVWSYKDAAEASS